MGTLTKPYAIISKGDTLTEYSGEIRYLSDLKSLELLRTRSNSEIIFANPFCSIREKSCEANGNEKIISLIVGQKNEQRTGDYLRSQKRKEIFMSKIKTDISDKEFSKIAANIQSNEIAKGNASQVVISRLFSANIKDFDDNIAKEIFVRLLHSKGQYMTYLFFTGSFYLVGASPECHLRIDRNMIATMNPIAGTIKKEPSTSIKKRMEQFLSNKKEINELFQVCDEELKMMSCICKEGGRMSGPFIKELGSVIHTEYELTGKLSLSSIDALRETLHAPTLVGSPLESSSSIIKNYEDGSRRYYGGQIGIYGIDMTIDTAINIRTAEIDLFGNLEIRAGAGIVKDSDPAMEAKETTAKASGMISLIYGLPYKVLLNKNKKEEFEKSASFRNEKISKFQFNEQNSKSKNRKNEKILIISCKDNFSYMISHLINHMGYVVDVIDAGNCHNQYEDYELVIMGPGPGNPCDISNQAIRSTRRVARSVIHQKIPAIGICLGHQIISSLLGGKIKRLSSPMQGMQAEVFLDGKIRNLGFYNSYGVWGNMNAELTQYNKYIIYTKQDIIETMQFHPESILSMDGYEILQSAIQRVLKNKNKFQFT